jgi:GT2 family glycosyltransferase
MVLSAASAVTTDVTVTGVTARLTADEAADVARRIGLRPYRGCVVIILNYGGLTDTTECLESLWHAGIDQQAVLVVDNASPVDDPERLHVAYPAMPIVRADTNYGFCDGNNIGATLARAAGATEVVLLNNDTTVATGFLDAFADYFAAHERVVLLNPKIVWYHAPDRIWFAGGYYSPWLAFPRDVARNRVDVPAVDAARSISFATGCALGIRLSGVPSQRLFVPEMFAYAEDLELTLRVRAGGGEVMYAPVTVVRHKEGRTFASMGNRSVSAYLSTRNVLFVGRQYLRWYHWLTASFAYTTFYLGRLALVFALRGDWAAVAALMRGTGQGLFGSRPPGLTVEPQRQLA